MGLQRREHALAPIAKEARGRATHLMRYAPGNFYAVMPESDNGRSEIEERSRAPSAAVRPPRQES